MAPVIGMKTAGATAVRAISRPTKGQNPESPLLRLSLMICDPLGIFSLFGISDPVGISFPLGVVDYQPHILLTSTR